MVPKGRFVLWPPAVILLILLPAIPGSCVSAFPEQGMPARKPAVKRQQRKPASPKSEPSSEVTLPDRPKLLEEGDTAPDFRLNDLRGKAFQLSKTLPKVKALVLNFWSAECGPCLTELPELNKLDRKLKRHGLRIIAINMGDKQVQIGKIWKHGGYSLPSLIGGDGILGRFRVSAAPATYVIDSQGQILDSFEGVDYKRLTRAFTRAGIQ